MISDRLFVYGTLMRGFDHPMAQLLSRSADFLGTATCRGRLYLIKHYPGLVLSDDPADRQSLAALIAGLVAALDTRVAHAGQSEPARPRRGEDRRGPRGDRWTPRAGAQRGSGD